MTHVLDNTSAMRGAAGRPSADAVFDRLLREWIALLGSEVDDAVANRASAQLLLLIVSPNVRRCGW